jgi:hypothetical protein
MGDGTIYLKLEESANVNVLNNVKYCTGYGNIHYLCITKNKLIIQNNKYVYVKAVKQTLRSEERDA